MQVFHISVECYPVAKVGGLADVVGALPKYQNKMGLEASVVMPWYNKPFVQNHEFEQVFDGMVYENGYGHYYQVFRETEDSLEFPLYLVKVEGLQDRDNVYGYEDDSHRFIAFQHAVLNWLCWSKQKPDIIHVHDYHCSLIPFFISACGEFSFLKGVKTIGTIHNGEYQGDIPWYMARFFPAFDTWKWGLLDWNGRINPMAAMIKVCTAFNTVSGGYLDELKQSARGLEWIIKGEAHKAYGILNGIDAEVWDPMSDPMIGCHYDDENFAEGKWENKCQLCAEYDLNPDLPLFIFIGRFVKEKGVDMLPDVFARCIQDTNGAMNFLVLGSGDSGLEKRLYDTHHVFSVNFKIDFGYKEELAHRMYSSGDFLLMPSRIEPCGLNQMYAMRYGTIPIVHRTGGLKDTVPDITSGGYGFNFTNSGTDDIVHAIKRVLDFYYQKKNFDADRKFIMQLNFSWENAAQKYLEMYNK